MANITIKGKDGTEEHLKDRGAPGGSYSLTVRYEGNFAIITNAYGEQRAIPSDHITEIIIHSHRR